MSCRKQLVKIKNIETADEFWSSELQGSKGDDKEFCPKEMYHE